MHVVVLTSNGWLMLACVAPAEGSKWFTISSPDGGRISWNDDWSSLSPFWITPVQWKWIDTRLARVRTTHILAKNGWIRGYKTHKTHVRMILEVTLGVLAWASCLEPAPSTCSWRIEAGRDGDGGTASSSTRGVTAAGGSIWFIDKPYLLAVVRVLTWVVTTLICEVIIVWFSWSDFRIVRISFILSSPVGKLAGSEVMMLIVASTWEVQIWWYLDRELQTDELQ